MLEGVLRPTRIAVIGASTDPGKLGRVIVDNLQASGFAGELVPVNRKGGEIAGLPAVTEVGAIPGDVDLAILCVPAASVPETLERCGRKRIRAAIVISAGFKEVGEEGRRLEEQLVETCRRHKIALIGPNTIGVLNPAVGLAASFVRPLPPAGHVGLMSQSGAVAQALLDMAATSGLGFSKVVSVGNKAVIDETDVLRALADDPETRVITAYVQDISRGDAFVLLAEEVSQRKPVVVVKAGTSEAGARASSSHTGVLAGADVAYEAAFARSGVIRANSLRQLLDYAIAFGHQPVPNGDRVAIVTNAGGLGILAADACEREGLALASLSEPTRSALAECLPPAATVDDPVDLLGEADPARYARALELILDDPGVDAVMALLTAQPRSEPEATARAIIEAAATGYKPVLASFVGGPKVAAARALLREGGVPDYATPGRAARCLAEMVGYRRWLDRPARVVQRFPINRYRVERVINVARRKGVSGKIGEEPARRILEAYGFNVPARGLARTREEATELAERVGYPVALKIASPDIVHKTDVQGVRLDIRDEDALLDAFDLMLMRTARQLPDARIDGVTVQQMIRGGREVILGVVKDRQFGHMLMFGMGGVYVEVLRDVAFHLAPITREEAMEMLLGTRTCALLRGVRGESPVDVDAVAEAIQRLSQLVTDFPAIEEMDINPLKVGRVGEKAWALDARFLIGGEEGRR